MASQLTQDISVETPTKALQKRPTLFKTPRDFKALVRDQEEPLSRIWKEIDEYWTNVNPQQSVQSSKTFEASRKRAVTLDPQTFRCGNLTSREAFEFFNIANPDSEVYYIARDLIPRLNASELKSYQEREGRHIKIPYEIQMKILDQLEIHEAHSLVHQSLPNLAVLWIPVLHVRFRQWFNGIFSRENMRYIGTTDRGYDRFWNLWRLRSSDLHPNIILQNQYAGPRRNGRAKFQEPPSLGGIYGNMMFTCLGLVAELEARVTEGRDGINFFTEFWIEAGRDYLRRMDPLQRKGCMECCERVVENGRMAFVFALGGCSCYDRRIFQRSHICDVLLLYNDELDVILANFRIIMKAFDERTKEIFMTAFMPSSVQDIKHMGPAIAIQTNIYEEGRCTALERCDAHAC